MTIRNFYPEAYIKAGSGISSFTTQAALTSALASWTHLHGSESNAELKEEAGKKVELMNGQQIVLSNIISMQMYLLEVTPDNYTYLRTNFHRQESSILWNEAYPDGTGRAIQVQNIYPIITKEGKSGDLLKIKIVFKYEAANARIEVKDLTSA